MNWYLITYISASGNWRTCLFRAVDAISAFIEIKENESNDSEFGGNIMFSYNLTPALATRLQAGGYEEYEPS